MAQLKNLIVNGTAKVVNKVIAPTFVGSLSGNAATATSCTGNAATATKLSAAVTWGNLANKS